MPRHGGLTPFGEQVVREMNRLGMLVDLSQCRAATMRAALDTSSRARDLLATPRRAALADHPRNVPDDVLQLGYGEQTAW